MEAPEHVVRVLRYRFRDELVLIQDCLQPEAQNESVHILNQYTYRTHSNTTQLMNSGTDIGIEVSSGGLGAGTKISCSICEDSESDNSSLSTFVSRS